MVNKLIAQFVVVIVIFGMVVGVAESQETSFAETYKEYQQTLNRYSSAHEEYVLARSQYLRFDTLKSKNEAFSATLNLLQIRDDVVVTYYEVLKARLDEVGGLDEEIYANLVFDIDEEIGWFNEHKARLPSSGDLEDLVEDSQEAEERFESGKDLIYKILTYIPKGRINVLRNKLGDLNNRIDSKVEIIKTEEREEYKFNDEKLSLIDEWLFESENRVIRVDNKLEESQEIIDTIGERRNRIQSDHNSAIQVLRESLQHLKEARNLSSEVVKEIKRVR